MDGYAFWEVSRGPVIDTLVFSARVVRTADWFSPGIARDVSVESVLQPSFSRQLKLRREADGSDIIPPRPSEAAAEQQPTYRFNQDLSIDIALVWDMLALSSWDRLGWRASVDRLARFAALYLAYGLNTSICCDAEVRSTHVGEVRDAMLAVAAIAFADPKASPADDGEDAFAKRQFQFGGRDARAVVLVEESERASASLGRSQPQLRGRRSSSPAGSAHEGAREQNLASLREALIRRLQAPHHSEEVHERWIAMLPLGKRRVHRPLCSVQLQTRSREL